MKENFEDTKLMPNGDYYLSLIQTKLIQSKTVKRYGYRFIFDFLDYPKADYIFHTIWLGNYKDFQQDDKEKDKILWNLANSFFDHLKITLSDLEQNKKLKKIIFCSVTTKNLFFPHNNEKDFQIQEQEKSKINIISQVL